MASLQSKVEQMVEISSEDDQPRQKKKTEPQKLMSAWKRLTLTLLQMIFTARNQMVIDYIGKRAAENDRTMEEQELQKYKSHVKEKTSQNKSKGSWINQGIGKPLGRSEAQKHWNFEVKSCNHPAEYLRCRANPHSKWWVCLQCGGRWERTESSPASSSTTVIAPELPQAQSLKGARTGKSYPQFLPAPRSRPQQGNIQLENDFTGKVAMKPVDTKVAEKVGTTPTTEASKTPPTRTSRSPSVTRKSTSGLRPDQGLKKKTTEEIPQMPQEYTLSDGSWEDEVMVAATMLPGNSL